VYLLRGQQKHPSYFRVAGAIQKNEMLDVLKSR
jgi:hypothetical protein